MNFHHLGEMHHDQTLDLSHHLDLHSPTVKDNKTKSLKPKKMPWLSPSGSPGASPRSRYSPTFGHSAGASHHHHHASALMMLATSSNHAPSPSVTYIPQLIDGACGTMPHSQRSVLQRLSSDMSTAARLLPVLVQAALVARVSSLEMMQHVGLALLEVSVLVSVVPLWLLCPGVVFLAWLGYCTALVVGASWSLNGGRAATRGRIVRSPSPAAEGWMAGQEVDDERWFFVGGMGMSATSLSQKTLPALSQLFRRPIESVHAPTYGLPLDFLALLLQRCLGAGFPSTAHSRALYAQIRTALLDDNSARTVVLAHNAGAVAVAQVLHQLYADLSADRMARLEIYTFGAAAADFSMPLSGIPSVKTTTTTTNKHNLERKAMGVGEHAYPHHRPQQQHHHHHQHQVHAPELTATRRGPHVEHFAFTSDPFAKMGVLRSVHEDLEGRFCGSVFELDCPGAAHHGRQPQQQHRLHQRKSSGSKSRLMISLNDYMTCLFPESARHGGESPISSFDAAASSASSASSRTSSRSRRQCRRHHQRPDEKPQDDHQSRVDDDDDDVNGSILDTVMLVDRDLAEKREFAALAQHSASIRSKGGKKRLSWTGLGATVGAPANQGNMDGVVGLEMARKGCRDCQGHRGRDVSRLARYVMGPPIQEILGQVGGREEEGEGEEMVVEDVSSLIRIAAAAPAIQVLE